MITKFVGITLLIMGLSGAAMALQATVPEISPVSAGSAVALIAGAVLIMRGRRKK
jgi:hypothetical protein